MSWRAPGQFRLPATPVPPIPFTQDVKENVVLEPPGVLCAELIELFARVAVRALGKLSGCLPQQWKLFPVDLLVVDVNAINGQSRDRVNIEPSAFSQPVK